MREDKVKAQTPISGAKGVPHPAYLTDADARYEVLQSKWKEASESIEPGHEAHTRQVYLFALLCGLEGIPRHFTAEYVAIHVNAMPASVIHELVKNGHEIARD